MQFNVKQAKRELIYLKIALMGPSGSGKTFSALRLATGMLAEMKAKNLPMGNGKILLANTEGPRGLYYANEFSYDIVDMDAPHAPENYVELHKFAVKSGYPILILDSSSHEWEGKGGCLDLHQQAGGTFQSWAKVTPRHNAFIEAIAYSQLHEIITMRGKDQYEVEKSEGGKSSVKKLGVGAQQRNGFEYEFTSTFTLDTFANMAKSQKDNTHLFEKRGEFVFSEEDGEKLIDWANSGEGYTPHVIVAEAASEDVKPLVIELCKKLGGQSNVKLMTLVKQYAPTGNPNAIKDADKVKELYEKLTAMSLEDETVSNDEVKAPVDETETKAE